MTSERTVAIVGAGPSGLAAAKVLLEDGFNVTLFDRQKRVGGVWCSDFAYADLKTQVVAGFMEFSNLPDPESKGYDSWEHIHHYLQKYADKFHITERIRFERKVVLIDRGDLTNANLPWRITVETINGHQQTLEFDFVVIASGLFSTPYVPIFRGQNKFAGSIVHACDVKTYEQVENKRVAVIGGGKCAVDLATIAGKYARSCDMIFRRSHWLIPYNLLYGYLPMEYVFTRIFTVMFDPFPYAPHSALFLFIHRNFPFILKKVFDIISAKVIATFRSDLFEDKIFLPKGSLQNTENFARITDEFIKLKREGRISRKLASVEEIIDETKILLDSGEQLQVDLIICATGLIEQCPFLSQTLRRAVGQNTTTSNEGIDLNLYRRMIPVGVPNISFVGFLATATTWMLFEVQSHWTSDYFLGRMKVPDSEKEMHEEIKTTRDFMFKQFNRKSYYCQYYWLEPMEIYLQDMGLALHRTNNWISEYIGIYRIDRIKTLHDERQDKAEGKTSSIWHRHWYFGFGDTILILILVLCIWFIF